MIIRTAETSDSNDIFELEKECFSQPLSKDEIYKILSNDLYSILILKKDDEYIGHIIFYTVQNTAEIISVAIKKTERNKGYAGLIIKNTINRCLENKTERILLEVRTSNEAAVALYKKAGFKTIAIRKNFYEKPQEDAYTMEMTLGKELI